MMKKLNFTIALGLLSFTAATAQVNVEVNAGLRGDTISDKQYGIFFEEINHAGDGGLYAELISNRSFEGEFDKTMYWKKFGAAVMTLETADATYSNMLNKVQGNALKVKTSGANTGVYNEGYGGINIVKDRTYKLSFWAKGTTEGVKLNGVLLSSDHKTTLGSVTTEGLTTEWKKYTATITATGDDATGVFAITSDQAATFYIDMVSLFPPTFKDRDNGCRTDLAQMLADLKPQFMRFPGGCYVEGIYNETTKKDYRYLWKNSLGALEDRMTQYDNNWGYDVNNGMGVYEFFQFSEDIGARPLYVVNVGMGHGWCHDYQDISSYIQEALDVIEFANGDSTTTYGMIRCEMGHKEPFNLRLMEVGNENYNNDGYQGTDGQSDHYAERYGQFREAIMAKYPYMELIGNGWGDSWSNGKPVEYVDEHYYTSPDWFISQYHKYDAKDRTGHKTYVGEYAVTSDWGYDKGNLRAALGEAVFMQGMEKNGEYCKMASYAPIFIHETLGGWWKPDMIHFNAAESFGTPSYYIQKLFPNNLGQYNVTVSETNNKNYDVGTIGVGTYLTSAYFDDIKVTDNITGKVLFSDDFSGDTTYWKKNDGSWSCRNGHIAQADASRAGVWNVYSKNYLSSNHYTYEVKATKLSGAEGFVIPFNYLDDANYCWFNVGGWTNTASGIEQNLDGTRTTVSGTKAFSVVNGQTYAIKIVVDSLNVSAYIDDVLIQNVTIAPSSRKAIYTSANIDSTESKIYLRIVNPYTTDQKLTVNIKNADLSAAAGQVLGGSTADDENTLENPTSVVPQDITGITLSGNAFTYTAKALSASFITLDVSNVTIQEPEEVTLPAAVLKYDFEQGEPIDSAKLYKGTLQGKAELMTMADKNNVLYTGAIDGSGYMDLGSDVAKSAFATISADYTISMDIMPGKDNNLGSYCWPYAFCSGTDKYVAMVNTAGNGDWYYEIKNGGAQSVRSGAGLTAEAWHNVTYVQKGSNGYIYVDGKVKKNSAVSTFPATFAASLSNAYFGKSPYGGDKLMENTYMDNFRLYDQALSADQVALIYDNTKSMNSVSTGMTLVTKDMTATDTNVYNTGGVTVGKSTSTTSLKNGVYIIDHKKVLVK